MPIIDLQAFSTGDFQLTGIEAKQLVDRRVNVGHVMTVLDRVKAEFISGPVDRSPLDSSAGQPHAKAERVVISTTVILPAG